MKNNTCTAIQNVTAAAASVAKKIEMPRGHPTEDIYVPCRRSDMLTSLTSTSGDHTVYEETSFNSETFGIWR